MNITKTRKLEGRLTRSLATRDGRVMATSRAGIDMEGLREEESKKRDKLEVGDHDSKSDSRQELD
jgi:hypothetical protein